MLRSPTVLTATTALLTTLATGCRPPTDPPFDQQTTESSTSGPIEPMATTFAAPDACQSTEDCQSEDLLCVAPYDPGLDPPVGPGACIEACVEADDLFRWCFDDAACCGELRCNEVDGFCESLAAATGDSTATEGETDSTGSDSSGTSGTSGTSGSSGSGSSGSGTTGTGTTGTGSSGTTGGT